MRAWRTRRSHDAASRALSSSAVRFGLNRRDFAIEVRAVEVRYERQVSQIATAFSTTAFARAMSDWLSSKSDAPRSGASRAIGAAILPNRRASVDSAVVRMVAGSDLALIVDDARPGLASERGATLQRA
jgi:hypothetical protein